MHLECCIGHVRAVDFISAVDFDIKRISSEELRLPKEKPAIVTGLCGGAEIHELFIAQYNGVCSINVRAVRLDHDAFTAPHMELVQDVAYSPDSKTLFVATGHEDGSGVSVRSLALPNKKWMHRIKLPMQVAERIFLRVLCDESFLCSQENSDCVYLSGPLQHHTCLKLPAPHSGFDAQQVSSEIRLAVALKNGTVALFLVNTQDAVLELLFEQKLPGARIPLFCGDRLLVAVITDRRNRIVREAVLFTTTNGHLKRERPLIKCDNKLNIECWCFADGMLFVWNANSKELLLFRSRGLVY